MANLRRANVAIFYGDTDKLSDHQREWEHAPVRSNSVRYRIGPLEFDLAAATLRKRGIEVPLDPKPLALLTYLLHNRNRVVSRSELLQTVWAGAAVSEWAVSSALRDLRRALGDDGIRSRFIATRKGYGYRFIYPLEKSRAPGASADKKCPACGSRLNVHSAFAQESPSDSVGCMR